MTIAVVALLWIAVGIAVGIIEGRRGHWRRSWVLTAIFGPLSIPLAVNTARRPPVPPTVVEPGMASPGDLDALIGVDGSPGSMAAVAHVADFLGARAHRVTLAAVLDIDTASPHEDSILSPEPYPEEEAAREHLQQAAHLLLGVRGQPRTVLLAGDPAQALMRYARGQGDDLIVVGARGRGITKAVFGSCATHLAGRSPVPVLIVPHATGARAAEPSVNRAADTRTRTS